MMMMMFDFNKYIAHLREKCHSSKLVIFHEKRLKVLKCYNFLRVQRRDTTALQRRVLQTALRLPVKSASANVSFYTKPSKMPNFEIWHFVANDRYYENVSQSPGRYLVMLMGKLKTEREKTTYSKILLYFSKFQCTGDSQFHWFN